MDKYTDKLFRLGIPMSRAVVIVQDFTRTYHGTAELEEYISDLESDCYSKAWDGVDCVY